MRCECGNMIDVPNVTEAQAYEFVEQWDSGKKKKQPTVVKKPLAPAAEEAPAFTSAKKDTVAGRYGPRRKQQIRRRGDADREVDRVMEETTGRWLMTLCVAGVVLLGVLGWAIRNHKDLPPPPDMRPDDKVVVDAIRESGATEAIEWLKTGKRHAVLGWSNEQALRKVELWYSLGAVKVLAFGEGITQSFAIELPDDPKKRQGLFAWQNDYAGETHQKAVGDSSQKYLVIELRF
jgi:hypothetical protein